MFLDSEAYMTSHITIPKCIKMQHSKKDIDIASDSGGWHISSDDHVNIRLNKATEIDARKHRET